MAASTTPTSTPQRRLLTRRSHYRLMRSRLSSSLLVVLRVLTLRQPVVGRSSSNSGVQVVGVVAALPGFRDPTSAVEEERVGLILGPISLTQQQAMPTLSAHVVLQPRTLLEAPVEQLRLADRLSLRLAEVVAG